MRPTLPSPARGGGQGGGDADVMMEQRTEIRLSPYHVFSRAEWAARREDTPMTLTPDEVVRLRTLIDEYLEPRMRR